MNVNKTNNTKEKVQELQRKLYQSAKVNKVRKFHALFDKVYRMDILLEAWKKVKANKGSKGVDGQTIAEIERIGIDKILKEIQGELKSKTYKAQPVLRREVPKPDGTKRPLGIPTVKDRIIQTAAKLVIEPIFEADFKDFSYGFRPKRSQHQALETIRKACNNNGHWVLDADIKGYFDNINHEKLMKLLSVRISDKRMLKLINKWLKAGVMNGQMYEESDLGSPQGGSISPLLSNVYLNYMDTIWDRQFSHLGKLIRFADDFVIISKSYKDVKKAYTVINEIMSKLDLNLSKEKTKLVSLWEGKEGFDFLGFHNRKIKSKTYTGREYFKLQQWISDKSRKKIEQKVREFLARNTLYRSLKEQIKGLNRKIVGWRNYYGNSRFDKLQRIEKYIMFRLVIWYNQKRQARSKRKGYYDVTNKIINLGLTRLTVTP